MANSNHRQTLLKRNNRAQILLGVQKHGPISRAQLARVTQLSMTCVCSIVGELLTEGTLIETGTITGQRGGPMVLLEINPDGAAVAGVWYMHEEIYTVIANPAADIIAYRCTQFDYANSTPEIIISAIKSEIEKCAETAGKDVNSLKGVGLCIGGMVDTARGEVVTLLEQYDELDRVPIVKMLSEALNLPVYADNDVRAGSFAAALLGDDMRDNGTLYITVCKGIGCSFIHLNDILRGAHDMSGQLCKMVIDYTAPSRSGHHAGTFESLTTDSAFINAIWPEMKESSRLMPDSELCEKVKQGLEMALSGDERAYTALTDVTKRISVGAANMINILDPRTVFIGGTLIDLDPDTILDMIRAGTLDLVNTKVRGVDIRPLIDYKDFVLRGAIGLVIGEEYRTLREDNLRTRMVSRLRNVT